MYEYTFSFTLKLATFHMWNIKRKDDGMNQKTLHWFNGEYVTANQQTQLSQTCCHDFASLLCHIIFKHLSKFLTTSLITTTLFDVLDKSRYPHYTS